MIPFRAFPVSLSLYGSEKQRNKQTQVRIFVFGFNEEHVKRKLSFFFNCSEAETIRDSAMKQEGLKE